MSSEYLPAGVADDITDIPAQSADKAAYYQIAKVDAGLLAWNFTVLDERAEEIASVDRAFRGFGREVSAFETVTNDHVPHRQPSRKIFTDTGTYQT